VSRSLIGRGIDRQLQRVGCTPSPRANLVLWHMHVPLPWHMHLCLRMIDRCRVTRPEQPTAARRFFPLPRTRRSARVATCCAFCQSATPPFYYQPIVHNCLLPTLMTTSHHVWIASRRNARSLNTATLKGTRPLFPSHHMHAFRRAIPGFPQLLLGLLTISRI
jgi:hypothetical protein